MSKSLIGFASVGLVVVVVGVMFTGYRQAPDLGYQAADYELADSWLNGPGEIGAVSGVDVDEAGTVHAFRRTGNNVWTLDSDGNLLKEWGQDIAEWTHGIRVDHEGFIWTIDGQGHQVKKWSPDGSELLMTLGEAGVAGEGPEQFDRPTDVAVAPNGDFFVADGYRNSRVAKFDRTGRFITAWGESGSEPGQFNTVHSIALDSRGRVLVADRENDRVQIFDQEGKFLDEWPHLGRPYSVYVTQEDLLYVADLPGERIVIASAENGEILDTIEDVYGVHFAAVDAEGNVYATSIRGNYLRKYVRR